MILFGIAFGYLEGAVVVYLRTINEPLRAAAGLSNSDLFPLLTTAQAAPVMKLVGIELAREAATIIMLAAVAWAAGTRWLPAFGLVFGTWDLAFYAALKILIGWPASFFTWDLLFLLPVPWAGPVLAPSLVAASMVVGGILALTRPVRENRISELLLASGAILIFASFIWDWRSIVNGGVPHDFPWVIFGIGEALGIAGLANALGKGGGPPGLQPIP